MTKKETLVSTETLNRLAISNESNIVQNKSISEKYSLIDIVDGIENKILERGTFTKLLGSDFDLSINIEEEEEDGEQYFDIHAKITSPEEALDDSDAEEISDYITERFYELLEQSKDEDTLGAIREHHRDNKVSFNGESVY